MEDTFCTPDVHVQMPPPPTCSDTLRGHLMSLHGEGGGGGRRSSNAIHEHKEMEKFGQQESKYSSQIQQY